MFDFLVAFLFLVAFAITIKITTLLLLFACQETWKHAFWHAKILATVGAILCHIGIIALIEIYHNLVIPYLVYVCMCMTFEMKIQAEKRKNRW